MRFALATTHENTTWEAVTTIWDVADKIDLWESAWTGDHFVPFLGDANGPCYEGWTSLTALAARTRRIRCGILVAGMPHRHPAVLAKMAGTLDVASGGRLTLGLGAAWNEVELGAFGIELGDLRTRFDRFDEGVEVITRLLADETTTFQGQHYQLVEARCSPKPVQAPRLPITIGGPGERRTARAVARWADHWDLGFTRPEDIQAKRKALAEHCAAIGRDPSTVTLSAVVLTRQPDNARRDTGEVADEIEAYAEAGCTLALVQALADNPDDARFEIEQLTATCEPLAAA